MKKTIGILLAVSIFLLFPLVTYAEGELSIIETGTDCSATNDKLEGSVIKSDEELLKLCQRLIVDKDKALKKAAEIKEKIDFTEQVIVYIIGEKSKIGYDVQFPKPTVFKNGVLYIVVKVNLPSKKSRLGFQKHPYYIYKTNPTSVVIAKLKKVIFCEGIEEWKENNFAEWEKECKEGDFSK